MLTANTGAKRSKSIPVKNGPPVVIRDDLLWQETGRLNLFQKFELFECASLSDKI